MKNIIQKLKLFMLLPLIVASFLPAVALADAKGSIICGVNSASGQGCSTTAQPTTSLDSEIHTVINLLSLVVGLIAIIMIIIAGLRYITSAGEAEKIKSAKNTLIYAIVGLVIVALAQTIAHFVLTEAANPSTAPGSVFLQRLP